MAGSGGAWAGWRAESPRQNRGDRGSRGAKDSHAKEVVPAHLKTFTTEDAKQIMALLHRTGGLAKQQGDKDTKWACPSGFCNFAFRQ